MQEITLLTTIAGAFIVLIVSPGPNFLVITQLAVNQSRMQGIYAGLGVATGSITWATLAATGLGFAFSQLPHLQPVLQFVGGAYLGYIGVNMLRNAGNQPATRELDRLRLYTPGRAYRFGLMTNLTNPKALAFYTSIFTTVTTPGLPQWVRLAGVAIIAVLAISWFALLATLFSIPHIQNGYRRAKKSIDITTGIVMTGFGLRLLAGLLPAHLLG